MSRLSRMRVAIPVLLLALSVAATLAGPASAQPNTVGQWVTLPYLMPINPIHSALMHTGKVVVLAGSENDQSTTTLRAAVWDPTLGIINVQNILWDFWCNGTSFLPDGRLLITGGNLRYSPNVGLKTTSIFDPATESFIQVQDMAHGRWYPTNTVLGDGRTSTFSGLMETYEIAVNRAVEIYDVPTGWSPEHLAPFDPPLYPWLHLLPNGKLFMSGAGPYSHFFDPTTLTWDLFVTFTGLDRKYGSSVLLPLRPETGYTPRVMMMGGGDPPVDTAVVIDLSQSPLAWRSLPPMSKPRIQMNAVLLPTGKVLALGGSAVDEVASTASLQADLFDPTTETWSSAGVATYPRLYHSVALLLPDATVWVAGSNPSSGTYEKHMEIYSPAYLFTTDASGAVIPATRPVISAAPTRVGYGATFTVQTPDAADIASVVLMRPGAATHAFDMEQRMVGLSFTVSQNNTLLATSPPTGNIAPPGYYMLFLVNRLGVPSVAKFVQLSRTVQNQPPTGQILSPAGDVTIAPGGTVTFDGTGTDPDGVVASYSWVFPTGTPATSQAAMPGQVVFPAPGKYIVSLTVTDNAGENDPSPPSLLITVQGGPLGPPDLLQLSVSAPPATVALGGSFTAEDYVQNLGPASAPPTTTRYYLSVDTSKNASDWLLTGSRSVPNLASTEINEGQATVTVPTSTPVGTYYLLACADDTGAVSEGNESNNCASSTMTVQVLGPDLVEASVSNPPASAAGGGSFSATDSASNQGAATAVASTTRFYLSLNAVKDGGDILLTGSRSVPSLAAGAASSGTITVTVPSTTASNTYFLLACADDTNLVSESNEGNNCLASTGTIQVTGSGPDLVEMSVSNPPASAAGGSGFSVTDSARNQGTAATGRTSTTRFYLSRDAVKNGGDILLNGTRSVPSLAAGATSSGTTSLKIPMATAPNPYFLLACADDTSKVAESNETNNCRASTATVQVGSSAGAPDLVETSVSNPPGSASPGGTFSVTDSVSNQGTATAAASTTRFYLSLDSAKDGSDILLTGNRSVPSLAAGAASSGTVTVTVPTTTAPNTYFLLACADDTSLVTESNETNNCRASTATVQVVSPAGAPDLVETSVSNPPGSASPGGTFSVTDNVSNQGTATAVASTTRFYLSLNAAKDGSDILLTGSRSVPSLAAGAASSGAVTVTIPATTALNTYFLLACADDTSLVAESNEANNCLASTTTVQVVASPGATFSLNPTSLVFAAAADGSFVASTEAVTITASNPSLAWSVSYDVTWLAVSPPSGIGSGAIFILPSATGLVPGTYHATVTVTGGGSSQQVAITFNVF